MILRGDALVYGYEEKEPIAVFLSKWNPELEAVETTIKCGIYRG